MKIQVCFFLFGALTVFACSAGDSDTSGSSGAQSSGGSSGAQSSGGSSGAQSSGGSSGAAAQCKLEDGTYTVKYTKTGGMASCADIPNQQVTVDSTKTTDAGTGMVDPRCMITQNSATCEVSTKCNIENSGFVTKTDATFKTAGSTASGTSKNTTVGPDGGVISDCSYSFTYTKN